MSILIKNVLAEGKRKDIYIVGNQIEAVGSQLDVNADKIIDGSGKAAIPGLINGHTHAAMTLFRGYADDMPLHSWLSEKIWPNEAKLTDDDLYWGTKLACLEMIKTGTTAFFDMYYHYRVSAKAVEEMGIRAIFSEVCFDHFDFEERERAKKRIEHIYDHHTGLSNRIGLAIGPHAIYTVSGELLQWAHMKAQEYGIPLHLHLAETRKEVADSVEQFGLTPVRYLRKLGILSPSLVAAHVLWIDDEEVQMLADYGVKVVHNPNSNMKLASGYKFKAEEMLQAGIQVGLGTDGCSSSNNLDMIETMKTASLLAKAWRFDPTALPAPVAFDMATKNGAAIFGLNAGHIAPGFLADIALIDLHIPAFTPNFNFISNLVYAANGSCVDTLICDGKIVMEERKVPGEEEIMRKAASAAYDLMQRK
ncbi:MAG: amidohydrolase [Bacteroidales bacterium]|nr:amidohydrolase [Bacteroidales bacterium]